MPDVIITVPNTDNFREALRVHDLPDAHVCDVIFLAEVLVFVFSPFM